MKDTTNLLETASVSMAALSDNIVAKEICNRIVYHVKEIMEMNKMTYNPTSIINSVREKNIGFTRYELIPLERMLTVGGVSEEDFQDLDKGRDDDPYRVFLDNFFSTGDIDGLYTDPASAKFHGNYVGGLFCHSLLVYMNCLCSAHLYGLDPSDVSLIGCLCHDYCKIGKYAINCDATGNTIISYNKTDVRYYNSIQHGPESVRRILNNWYLTCDFMKVFESDNFPALKDKKDGLGNRWMLPEGTFRNSLYNIEWEQAVAYHMGLFDVSDVDEKAYSTIVDQNPYVLMLHTADMLASKVYGM